MAGVQIRQFLQADGTRGALLQAHHALERGEYMVLDFFVEITGPTIVELHAAGAAGTVVSITGATVTGATVTGADADVS